MTYSSFTMKQRKGMYWANTLKDSNIDIFKQLCSVQSEEFHFSVSFLSEFIRVLFT